MNSLKWTEEENAILREKIGSYMSYEKMMPFLPGRTANSIKSHAKALGIKNPSANSKYTFDRNYFTKPNYINSFFGGWVSADGCISVRRKKFKDLQWAMESGDREFLELFKSELKYTGPLYERYNHGIKYIDKDGEFHSTIHLSSLREMADDLENNFNIVPNKTHRLGPPKLKDIELKLAFWVGYLNGDGCLAFSTKKGLSVRMGSASFHILEWLRDLYLSLEIKTPRNRNPNIVPAPGAPNCKLFVIAGIAAIRIYELLKLVPVPVLKRKWVRPEVDAYIAEKKLKHPEYFEESIESIIRRNKIDFSKTFPSPENNLIIPQNSV